MFAQAQYDSRKDFARGRVRVKGRFVTKHEEAVVSTYLQATAAATQGTPVGAQTSAGIEASLTPGSPVPTGFNPYMMSYVDPFKMAPLRSMGSSSGSKMAPPSSMRGSSGDKMAPSSSIGS
jgi:hypothetical protein